MIHALDCEVYFNSTEGPPPDLPCGAPIDVATQPAAAHQLIKLGISPRQDLPAVLLREPEGKLRVVGLRLTPAEAAGLADGRGFAAARRRVYSASWCADCRRAKRALEDAELPFEEIDIDRDPRAEALVLERSGGRRVVPTLSFDDRLWAFNPDPPLLRRLLAGDPR